MRINRICFAAFLVLIINACSPTVYDKSLWQEHPVIVDGSTSEWELPLPFYDSKTKLNYTVTNDRENIYICIRAVEREAQMRMLVGGMKISFDTTGKTRDQVVLEYPMPHPMDPKANTRITSSGDENIKQDAAEKKQRLFAEKQEMLLSGFHSTYNGRLPVMNAYGIKTALKDSAGVLTYEAAIPFRTFYKDTLSPADSLKKISIGITLNGIASTHRSGGEGSRGGGSGSGMRGGGMRGGGGGRGGGMHGGGGRGVSDESSTEEKSWITLNPSVK